MATAYLQRMGERMRDRRLELGLSRSDLARKLPGKTNENSIYRWENGAHRPADDTLEALAAALDTTVAYFMADEPVPSPTPDAPLADDDTLRRVEAKLDRVLAGHVDALKLLLAATPEYSAVREQLLEALAHAVQGPAAGTSEPGQGSSAK
jgi:transcriptional regulator with XRE-family HTH domain